MLLYSSHKSSERGELSVLAIAETLLAISGLVLLSIRFNTTRWLAIAVTIAPLLLLRTEDSVETGVRWLKGWQSRLLGIVSALMVAGVVADILLRSQTLEILSFVAKTAWENRAWNFKSVRGVFIFTVGTAGFVGVLYGVVNGLRYFFIRSGATFVALLRHPVQGIVAIPGNWRRIVFSTDSAMRPEFVPGAKEGPMDILKEWENWYQSAFWNSVFAVLYAATVGYRWSVKATCLIYLPFIWLIARGRYSPASVQAALEDHQASDLRRIRLAASVLVVSGLVVKVLLMMTLIDFQTWWNANGALQVLKIYVVPNQVPLWQLASALNGVLAISLWLYARWVVREAQRGRAPADNTILVVWRSATVLSASLSLYTICCTVILTWKMGNLVETLGRLWNLVGTRMFP